MTVRRILLGALCVLAVGGRARAEQPAEADALFRGGLEQMRAGHYETACPMLERSYRLDPLPGALFTLADCEAAWGRVATAIEHYQAFVNGLTALPPERRSKFDERRSLALEKIASLGPLASQLAIDASPTAPSVLVIKRNGAAIERETYGVSKRVDPGEYSITAELDGKIVWERRVSLAPGDRANVEVPWIEAPIPSMPTSPASTPAGDSPPARPHPAQAGGSSGSRTLAYFAGGLGAGAVVAGVVTGLIAVQQKGIIDSHCPNKKCDAIGRDAVESARTAADVSTIGFSLGIASFAGATLLWITSAPASTRESSASVRPLLVTSQHGATVGVEGAF